MPGRDSLQAASDILLQESGVQSIAENLEWIQRVPAEQAGWLFVLFFVLTGFFAWIRIYYGSILVPTIQASSNFQVASRMFMDNSVLQRQLDQILYGYYFFSAGFMVYVVEMRFQLTPYGLGGFRLFLFNVALLGLVFLVRLVLMNLAGFLFNKIRFFREYLYNTLIFNKLLGIGLLPLLLFAVYTSGTLKEVAFWLLVAAAAVVIILKMIRVVVFSFKKRCFNILYVFIPLCP